MRGSREHTLQVLGIMLMVLGGIVTVHTWHGLWIMLTGLILTQAGVIND